MKWGVLSCLPLDFTASHSAIVQRQLCSFSESYLFFLTKTCENCCTNEQRHKCVCDVILEYKWYIVYSFKYLASNRGQLFHIKLVRGGCVLLFGHDNWLASWQLHFFVTSLSLIFLVFRSLLSNESFMSKWLYKWRENWRTVTSQ
jgi:hypothetical protein